MTAIIIVAALIATGAGALILAARRQQPTRCPGLEAIPGSVDRLVAIATGEKDPDAALRETLDHLATCEDCADRFRTIMILRGAPATGAVHFTPESLRAMTDKVSIAIH